MEEVNMVEYDVTRGSGEGALSRDVYNEDSDEEEGPTRVGCAHQ